MVNKKLDELLDSLEYFTDNKKIFNELKDISLVERKIVRDEIRQVESGLLPSDYLVLHDRAWRIHNSYDNTLMKFQRELEKLPDSLGGMALMKELYPLSVEIDRIKRIFCNGLKGNLENYSLSLNLSPQDKRTLFTPTEPSFYIEYARDLFFGDLDYLAKKYFRGSIKLTKFALSRDRKNLNSISFSLQNEGLHKKFLLREKFLLASRLKDNSEVFAVNKLLERDNFREYVYRKSLVGMGDLYLHRIVSEVTGLPIHEYDKKIKFLKEGNWKGQSQKGHLLDTVNTHRAEVAELKKHLENKIKRLK